jgi:glyoxylase-like metal-dependent hydrolase (beta-lactamase superfamily II)
MGAGPHPSRGNLTGNLLNELQNIGISPDDVDIVVHTHLHADHVGWNITYEDGVARPTFPKAKYLVPRADWEHFIQANILSLPQNEHIRDHVAPLEELGVMELVEGGQIITSEISTLHTPGHTPGHQCILIDSQGQRGVVVGDVIHMSVQIEHSDWCAGVDLDKPTGQKSREDLLDQSEREGLLIVAGHFKVNEHFGRVARLEGRRYWQVI